MRNIFFLTLSFLLLSLISCSSSDEYNHDVENERILLAKSDKELYIKNFNKLPISDKYSYFSNKIDQIVLELESNNIFYLSQDLIEIKKVYISCENNSSQFIELKKLAISFSEKVPDEDFLTMFTSLKNYKYSGFKGIKSGLIKNLILSEDFKQYVTTDNPKKDEDLPDCNCNWACDYLEATTPGGTMSSDCNETSTGCGFLGLGSCYRVISSGGIPLDI